MDVDTLSDQDLRRLLKEHGVNSPVTASTRNVLKNKLSKVISETTYSEDNYTVEEVETSSSELISEPYVNEKDLNNSIVVEEVVNAASCMVTDAGCNTSQDYTRRITTEVHTPARNERRFEEDLSKYEYTPTTNSLRYAHNSYPCDDDLRRRPLNTPHRDATEESTSRIEKKTYVSNSTTATTAESNSSWTRWLCNRFLLLLVLVLVLTAVLVYFHMDENPLPIIHEKPASTKQPKS